MSNETLTKIHYEMKKLIQAGLIFLLLLAVQAMVQLNAKPNIQGERIQPVFCQVHVSVEIQIDSFTGVPLDARSWVRQGDVEKSLSTLIVNYSGNDNSVNANPINRENSRLLKNDTLDRDETNRVEGLFRLDIGEIKSSYKV